MARSVLSEFHFQNEAAAFAYVEARLWPSGPVCHHCGERDRVRELNGKSTRPGLYKCYGCKKPFTVRMGTLFESSHLPLQLWLQIIHLMCASKKGISTNQIQRMLRCSMKNRVVPWSPHPCRYGRKVGYLFPARRRRQDH
jgi:transposase-like protein